MTIKKLKTGLWVVEAPTPEATKIQVFETYEEVEAFMFKPYLKLKTNIMNTLKNNFRKLELQVKVLIISTLFLTSLFTVMILLNGFIQF